MFSRNTPTFYHPKTLLHIHHKTSIIMSLWPGGDFYALSGIRSQHEPWGYYEFDPHGRLTGPVGHQSNPTSLAARTNPRTRVSHNASRPDARFASLVTVDNSILDSWQARLSHADGLLDGLGGLQPSEVQASTIRLRSLLEDVRRGIGRRVRVD